MTVNEDARTQELLDGVIAAIVECDSEKASAGAKATLEAGVNPVIALQKILNGASDIVGQKFDEGEYYLPHLVMAGDAMAAVAEVLEPAIPKGQGQAKKVVVIATVEADLHSIGKNIVGMMMRAAGFQVHDLGVDAKSSAIIAKAKEVKADIIALSSLLTTTMPYQREVIDDLKAAQLRGRFLVMVGGGAVTQQWAEQIGADGYGQDAIEAVKVARKLIADRGNIAKSSKVER